ncbi:MAG: PD-(D/E)XK nuclease family protein, partial [Bryobacteraceae bacterium]|nr:PD-(D/E)XK nuclease family protein [Bryobacteraceae bacterium]
MSATSGDVGRLGVGPLSAVSPSLAELLRNCKLRAGFSRIERATQFVLGNPKAWLGTAYHEVLAAAASHTGTALDNVVSAAWERAIRRAHERAKAHPLDRRFGEPETWPGYHVIAAMARVRAQQFAADKSHTENCRDALGAKAGSYREQKFSGAGGKLVGRPDVVRPDVIIDFKSGSVHEQGAEEEVRASYVRQLRLYAFLVKEALGSWPQRGILVPMIGSPVEI